MGSERYKSQSVGDVVSAVKSNRICIGDIGAYERNLSDWIKLKINKEGRRGKVPYLKCAAQPFPKISLVDLDSNPLFINLSRNYFPIFVQIIVASSEQHPGRKLSLHSCE